MAADEEALELTAAAPDDVTLDGWVARRTAGEPLAWITGTAKFCGISVSIDPGVYVPRWQSEPLARKAADLLPTDGTGVDLCAGSGAVALVLRAAHPRALVLATEAHPLAFANARRNGVDVRKGHLLVRVRKGVAHKMHAAPLPGRIEYFRYRGLEPEMRIGNYKLNAA